MTATPREPHVGWVKSATALGCCWFLSSRVSAAGGTWDRAAEIEATLGELISSGQLVAGQSLLPGFEQLPAAFVDSFSNGRPGKVIIDLTA
ncbi:hypothetical protein ACQP1O_17985 [Nocardia sp. CA-151230]|uniref:hypothetical protein n=1 Tax=Nocardia sp. CA-151230 TaxID=3239982 RepID=UPI003D92C7DD